MEEEEEEWWKATRRKGKEGRNDRGVSAATATIATAPGQVFCVRCALEKKIRAKCGDNDKDV